MRKVAVVILNWNGQEMLHRFLPGVLRCSGPDAQIYVADNASTDGSVELVRSEFPSVKLISLSQNYGFAEGYNKALSSLTEPYFLLLNSDVEVTEHWLDPLLSFMEEHKDVAALQPKILSERDRKKFEYAGASGGYIDWLGYPYCRGRIFGTVEEDKGQYDEPKEVFWASGAALFVRKQDWKEAGGLDGRFFAHMEEIDFCWRLHTLGRKIYCVPQSTVYHVGAATLKKENPRKTFLNFRNNLLMIYKNVPEKQLKRILCVRHVLDMLAALEFLFKGERRNAQAVFMAWREFSLRKKEFLPSRRENLFLATHKDLSSLFGRSVLWQYYVMRRKTYRAIHQ